MNQRVALHIAFWILYCLSWIVMDALYGISFEKGFYRYLGCVFEIPFYYIHMYILWPKFIEQKKYLRYFVAFIPMLILSSVLVLLYRYYIEYPILLGRTEVPDNLFEYQTILRLARSILQWFAIPTVIKIFRNLYQNKIELARIEKEKIATELSFLKSQMNPHFLFNTLNNLYGLALQGSKKTPDALMQLSNILSYTLYDGSEERIALEKEIQLLNDYIDLERLRLGERLHLDFEITGNLQDIQIPPLMLIHLVENAFKHSSLNQEGDVNISIKINVDDHQLTIETRNPLGQQPVGQQLVGQLKGGRLEEPVQIGGVNKEKSDTIGIGVQNLRRRLEIIFPENHSFLLSKKQDVFYATLKIPIAHG